MQDWVGKVMMGALGTLMWWLFTGIDRDLAAISASLEANAKVDVQQAERIAVLTADRYTATQARGDYALVDQRIRRLEEWAARLSDRLQAVEGRRYRGGAGPDE